MRGAGKNRLRTVNNFPPHPRVLATNTNLVCTDCVLRCHCSHHIFSIGIPYLEVSGKYIDYDILTFESFLVALRLGFVFKHFLSFINSLHLSCFFFLCHFLLQLFSTYNFFLTHSAFFFPPGFLLHHTPVNFLPVRGVSKASSVTGQGRIYIS